MTHIDILEDIKGITQEHINLCNILGTFVNETCITRDASHGYEHMKKVARNSLIIYNNTINLDLVSTSREKFCRLLLAVSWLHDVADKKYDHDGKLGILLKEFVLSIFDKDADLILDTIIRTSYSNEINMAKIDWHDKLGPDGVILRNIVSDADKIEALGYIGVVRCMTFTIETFKKNGMELIFDKVIKTVKEHADDKLLRLLDNYIKTDYGKELAKPLHIEMIAILNDNAKLCEIFDYII